MCAQCLQQAPFMRCLSAQIAAVSSRASFIFPPTWGTAGRRSTGLDVAAALPACRHAQCKWQQHAAGAFEGRGCAYAHHASEQAGLEAPAPAAGSMLSSRRQAASGKLVSIPGAQSGRWSGTMSNPRLQRLHPGSHQALVGATALAGSVCMHQAQNPVQRSCTLRVCQQRGSILIWSLHDCGHPMPPPALERLFALPPCAGPFPVLGRQPAVLPTKGCVSCTLHLQ